MRAWLFGLVIGAALLGGAPVIGQTAKSAEILAKYEACTAHGTGHLQGQYTLDQRLGVCNAAIASRAYQGEDLATFYFNRSAILNAKGEPAAALSDLDAALAAWPQIIDTVASRAYAYMNDKKFDLAQADLDHADKALPGNWHVLYYRARLHLLRGEIALARKDADAALLAQPGNADVLREQSSIKAAGGDVDGAIAILDTLVALHPQSEDYYNLRCYVRAVANRDLDKALADCDAALKIKPQAPYILDSRGLVYLRMGRYADFITDYTAAITLPDNASPASFYGRGLAEQQSGNAMGASADMSAAEALSPGIGKKFDTLAMMAE